MLFNSVMVLRFLAFVVLEKEVGLLRYQMAWVGWGGGGGG